MEEKNELGNVTVEENNAKKSKAPIIAGLVIIILVLVAAIWGVVNASSKTEKFGEDLINILGFMDDMQTVNFEDGKIVADIAVNPSLVNSLGSEDATPLSRIALVSELNVEDEDFSGKVYLDVDSTELVTLQYAKTGDLLGFIVDDLMTEKLVVKNENLKALAEKLGMSEEDIEMIPDKLAIDDAIEMATQGNLTSENQEKILEIIGKYESTIENNVEKLFVKTKGEEIVIGDTSIVTTKTSLQLTEKEFLKLLKDVLVILKEDEDLYNLLEENVSSGYESFEEWQTECADIIEEAEVILESGDDLGTVFELSTYTKGKNTVAVDVNIPLTNTFVRLAVLSNKNNSQIELTYTVDNEKETLILTTENADNELKGTLAVAMVSKGVNMNMNILDYSVKYSKDAVVEKIDLTKDFLLNDKSQEEIDSKFNEITKNVFKYLSIIVDKAPESLMSLLGLGTSNDDYSSTTGYDSDYIDDSDTDFYFSDDGDSDFYLDDDEEYDFTLDFDYEEE